MIDTKIVAIINITPDSFSGDGHYQDADAALRAIEQAIADGADVIDIGAESTRPGATPLTHEQEWERLAPVMRPIKKFPRTQFSIDTRHAETAAKALAAGVHWINDVSGFSNPDMVAAVASSNCKLVMMHSLSVPADKNIVLPASADVTHALIVFAQGRISQIRDRGISRERIIFDPGIGFGKTAPQSLTIIREIKRLNALDLPLMIGHSRKSFLAGIASDRDEATLAVSEYLALHGASYLRVHDVARHRRMLEVMKALHG